MMKAKLPVLIDKSTLPKQVRHPYSFTEQYSKFEFSMNEMRIVVRILQVIKDIQQYDKPIQIDINKNVEIRFKVKDLLLTNSKNQPRLHQALKSLRERTITNKNATILDENGQLIPATEMFGFIESAIYSHNNSIVAIKMKDSWFKYLMDLSRGYTQYMAEAVFRFSNPYAPNFYFYINHWFDKKGMTMTFDKFIEKFEIPKDYNISKIESRILHPVRNELNKIAEKSFNWKITYTNGIERSFDEVKPRGRGIKPEKISLVFYSLKDREPKKLTEFDHGRAQVFIGEIKKKYAVATEGANILYGLIRYYGLEVFLNTERELRGRFKGLKDMDFVNRITIEVRRIRDN